MDHYEVADTNARGIRTWTVVADGMVVADQLTEDEADTIALFLNSDCQAVTA